jgi:uncharacterized protein YdeI (YjbR/CyaY-like superfamily)
MKSKTNPKVDAAVRQLDNWREETEKLRAIALSCQLTEELKWGCPCYTYDAKNIVLVHGFKEYCAFLFFKGALLKDPNGILVQQTENVQAARQIRFTGIREIVGMKNVLKSYIEEAIAVEKSGAEVPLKKTAEFKVPEELENKFRESPKLRNAFEKLTPGRQRAYLLHFSAPKQSATRVSRIEKCVAPILAGKGLNDHNRSR